jgi:FtsH-binding integral membrane protein
MFYMQEHNVSRRIEQFMYAVYGFMAAALMLTAVVAYYVSVTPKIMNYLVKNPYVFIGLAVAQIVLVIGISAAIRKISFVTALTLFFVYAILLGITLSSLFFVFKIGSIYQTFAVAAAMFAGMGLYGYFTRRDLTSVGSIGIMIVWGMMVSMLINMWWQNSMFELMISGCGVVVFALLTAYDTQRIKTIAQEMFLDDEGMYKVAVIGALTLYLDFINLFLFLLQFMGQRKDS